VADSSNFPPVAVAVATPAATDGLAASGLAASDAESTVSKPAYKSQLLHQSPLSSHVINVGGWSQNVLSMLVVWHRGQSAGVALII